MVAGFSFREPVGSRGFWRDRERPTAVIASGKRSNPMTRMDCFVAPLLAMTSHWGAAPLYSLAVLRRRRGYLILQMRIISGLTRISALAPAITTGSALSAGLTRTTFDIAWTSAISLGVSRRA